MSIVGNFPGLNISHRRTIRAPVNPLDKSTIVSVFPRHIHEVKHTIQPGVFDIPAGSVEKPAILVVGPSSWWKDIDIEQPLLEIPNSSIQVADSIVKDYCNGLLACKMGIAMPGLFWVPGEFTLDGIKKQHGGKLVDAIAKQRAYFAALVKMADVLWSNTNGNPLTISDDMKLAAKELNLNNKDWLKDFHTMEQVRCVGCGALRNPEFPICGNCKMIVDPEKAKALNIQFAK